ncbi:MAG: beta-phosphoglucomutase [Clostridia bacterium]|nr:beta-phosphoglucomutase [Clostridia bacterium]
MKKGIIFDLDGVIVHTDKFHYLSWKALADSLGIYFDEQINNRCRGVSRMDSLEIVLEKSATAYTQEEKLAFAESKNRIYRNYLLSMTEKDVDPVVRQTLAELKQRGYLIAVGSSSKNTKLILKQVGLDSCFDAICDGNMITHSKPHPEVFLKAAEMINLPAEVCYVVEDAVAGVQAGISANMRTFAIGDAAKANVATYNITSLGDILTILD